jgi:D-beta-D-heptose 7-phosphate kinase/D-beta-D-heptose 1-phosphate adenosyltransferase
MIKNKLVVIGESCLDNHIYGECTRVNPEAPSLIFKPTGKRTITDGMAGNVYNNLVSLGCNSNNIYTIFPPKSISKTRYVDQKSGYILLRVDEGEPIGSNNKFDIKSVYFKSIEWETVCAVIISDYCKGFLSEKDISEIIAFTHNNRILTFLDTKKILGDWSKNVDFVKINRAEYDNHLKAGVGQPSKFCKNLIVTLGAEGMWWVNRNIVEPTEKINVSDVSGCGDSALAAFAIEYIKTQAPISSMKYANRVARIAASKQGVVAVLASEVK